MVSIHSVSTLLLLLTAVLAITANGLTLVEDETPSSSSSSSPPSSSSSSAPSSSCSNVTTVVDFNITEYTRASWYTQKQQVTGYQSANQLFCVVATYQQNESQTVPGYEGPVIQVYNQANEGSINNKVQNDRGMVLCARESSPGSSEFGQLLVAPCFVPNWGAGPYWVLAVGNGPVKYDTGAQGKEYGWAVVSAGQPNIPAKCNNNGGGNEANNNKNDNDTADPSSACCTTSEEGINDSGLWFLTREPVANAETIEAMTAAALAQNVAVSKLVDVAQEGCTYEGYMLKPTPSSSSSSPSK